MLQGRDESGRDRRRGFGRDVSRVVGRKEFGDGSPSRRYNRNSGGHRLDDNEAEAPGVVVGGEAETVAVAEQSSFFIATDEARVIDGTGEVGLREPGLKFAFLGSVDECAGNVEILSSWLQPGHQISLTETAAWQEVRRSAPADLVALAETRCADKPFTAAIMHGDFAPWNIRAAGDHWTVIDWERGCLLGIPGWDWFHYWIQSDALVARKTEGEILARLDQLIQHPAFRKFAARAEIEGRERGFIFAYLLHAVFVLRQTEGLATVEALLAKLAK